ncbi:MAG: histidine kinase [Ferruginibacter sp.]
MSMQEFIFANTLPQRLYRHIVFWVTLYIFSLLTYFHDFLEKLGFAKWMLLQSCEVFLHVVTQMLFCYAVLYYLRPVFLNRKKYSAFTIAIAGLSVVVYFIYYWEHIYFFRAIHAYVGLKFRPPAIVYWFTLISLITYFPISTGLALAIKMLKDWYNKQMENERLIQENVSAELQLLKAQIHPHFLFNTLNNIYSFTLDKSPRSTVLVEKLSGTLHYMINDCEAALVPLSKEIEMIKDYVELEKVRYGSRLKMELDINGKVDDKMITPLLLIPFIENSFKHGASQILEHPWIRLLVTVTGNYFSFELSNSKPSANVSKLIKSGIGLNNVKKRLELLYPTQYKLDIKSTAEVFSVSMQIPLETFHVNTAGAANHNPFTVVTKN